MPPFTEAKLTNPVFEGTWDELLGHSQEFAGQEAAIDRNQSRGSAGYDRTIPNCRYRFCLRQIRKSRRIR